MKASSLNLGPDLGYKIFARVEGAESCYNDVIWFKSKPKAKFNLIYFGGDIQVIIVTTYEIKSRQIKRE